MMAPDSWLVSVLAKEPTPEQCSENAVLYRNAERIVFAAWHPQWGGYVGRCIVDAIIGESMCFDVWVWHDGEFPRPEEPPRLYHYCGAEQLVDFGQLVQRFQGLDSIVD